MIDSMIGIFEIFLTICDAAFDLWPLAVLAGLAGHKRKRESRVLNTLSFWFIFALARIIVFFVPEQTPSLFIPEPLNTWLFVAFGLGLVALRMWTIARSRRFFQQKTGSVRSVEDLLALSPTEFEDMIVKFFEYMGCKAKRTGSTGDHGVDVEVEGKDNQRWVVQCKRWRGSVGEPMVRDFYGTMQHHKADRGFMISAGKFTQPARTWVKGKPITLYDGEQFLQKWWQAQKKRTTPQTASPAKDQAVNPEAGR